MATGTATLDFTATPSDSSTILVTGLSGLTANSHLEAFVQGSDSTGSNTAQNHKCLALMGRFNCEYVSATSFNINCDLMGWLCTNTFTVHYATA